MVLKLCSDANIQTIFKTPNFFRRFTKFFRRGHCNYRQKDYAKARTWYERYLKVGKPGTKIYQAVQDDLDYVNRELFMLEK